MRLPWQQARPKRLCVLSIDGVPLSLLQSPEAEAHMPFFTRLKRGGGLREIHSVHPVVSSVAWASFLTGVNPGRHGIFGFVDKDEEMHHTILTGASLRAPPLWTYLNQAGLRTILINVPSTYPPRPLDGILISDFLTPSIGKAAFPCSLEATLVRRGYIIDPDPWKAKVDREGYLWDCHAALEARTSLALELLGGQRWEFFMLHLMETDRVNHLYLDAAEDPAAPFHQGFWDFYQAVDRCLERLVGALPGGCELVILSDHGFCPIRKEVELNVYLREAGFLRVPQGAREPAEIDPASRAYCLIPGRVFVNLKGREPTGTVAPSDYDGVREEVAAALLEMRDPDGTGRVIRRVFRREELYRGPLLERAADLVAHPERGYELKAVLDGGPLYHRSHRVGMHTYRDAALFVRRRALREGKATILDVSPTLFNLLDLGPPEAFEGRSLLV